MKEPYKVTQAEIERWKNDPAFPFPNLSEQKRFPGWEITEVYFVDSSGFGAPGEPALTIEDFIGKLRAGYGYAITGVGLFQVYVTEFKQVAHRKWRAKS